MNEDGGSVRRSAVAEPIAERERASATPVIRVREPRGGGAGAAPPERVPAAAGGRDGPSDRSARPSGDAGVTLRERQIWFANAIMSQAPDVEAISGDPDAILTAGPQMSGRARLDVYRQAYVARLIECLADDYPALRSALGEEEFERLCREYIARHPSRSPSLNAYGRRMAELCRDTGRSTFTVDLATLEWAIVEVIHAPSAAPLTPAGLADIPVERWAGARLETTPAFRLLRFDYPVNAYFQAFRQGQAPAVPNAAPSAAAVYRSGATVWRMDLPDAMYDLLGSLASGETLGASLERAAGALSHLGDDAAVRRVMGWFRDWVSNGLFRRVEFA